MALAAGTRLGPYEIVHKLGEGGMGEVYRGRDTKLHRDVAIKVLRPAVTDPVDGPVRFEREARVLASLDHPNIARIFGFEESGPVRALVMELVEGPTLADVIGQSPVPTDRTLRLGRQLAEALEAAHSQGIVHRDLKPANIKVKPDGTLKVLDFGLAKADADDVPATDRTHSPTAVGGTVAGVLLGTAPYMSPEQARGKPVDKRTDIFAFGCVLYELLAGRRAFDGETVADAIVAVLEREPDWSALPPDTPAGIRRILERCLEKDLERRTHDIADARIEIEDALTGTATARGSSRSPWRMDRLRRGVAVGVLAATALAVGAVLYLWPKSAAASISSVAVLPFANQNRDEGTEFLSDALTENIINKLSQFETLRVIARASAFRYKGAAVDQLAAGKQLGVGAVVVGRVLQRGENLIVSAELVDVMNNKQLWGQQYSRRVSDLFTIQEEIAREISETLRVKLTGTERRQLAKRPTENLRALQLYMQGRSHAQRRTREDMHAAIQYYERAIEQDQNYALAFAGLTDAYNVLGARGYITPQEGRRRAEESARRALALDDSLAEAHFAASQPLLMFPPYDFPIADRELRRALDLTPGLAMAYNYVGLSYSRQGRFDESSAAYLRARELDPLSLISARAALIPVLLRGEYDRARDGLRQSRDLGPSFVVPFEIGIYIQSQLFDEARTELDKARQQRHDDPMIIYSAGVVSAAQGRRAEALQAIRELEALSGDSLSQAHWIAKVYSALGERALALSWLERGLAVRAIADFFKDEPIWNPIRTDPRFAALVRQMRIPD